MNKNDLIGAVADVSGLSKTDATRAVEAVFESITSALTKGDEVMTQSGIAGRVTKIQDDFITVEIADKVEVKMQRSSVAYVLKGLLKNI